MPTGTAWPRDPEAVLMRLVGGLGEIWGTKVDPRAADLLEIETDPRLTFEMLPEWERAFGLPDECLAEVISIEDRRKAVLNRMTTEGGQSRQFFFSVAAALGYNIAITEYSPFMCGVSRVGDTRTLAPDYPDDNAYYWETAPPEIRFYWKVRVFGRRLTWFRCGVDGGECGVDPMVRIALATDLECVLRRWKPAHTKIVFDYSNASGAWAEYVWFRCGGGGGQCGINHLFEAITHGGVAEPEPPGPVLITGPILSLDLDMSQAFPWLM